jgi:hypothetical protein
VLGKPPVRLEPPKIKIIFSIDVIPKFIRFLGTDPYVAAFTICKAKMIFKHFASMSQILDSAERPEPAYLGQSHA